MNSDNSIKAVYELLIDHLGIQSAMVQMNLLSIVASIYATMHTYPAQLCITEQEFNELERIRTNPYEPQEVPECVPRVAYDTVTVIKENNPHAPIEVTMSRGVNETYANEVFRQYEKIYDLMINSKE